MDIRQIELFIAAAEEQHFTRAAKRAHIVQSGLSVTIRALEEELGAALFVRNTRRVELSEAGRNFLPEDAFCSRPRRPAMLSRRSGAVPPAACPSARCRVCPLSLTRQCSCRNSTSVIPTS
jgi:hypothetical protein